MDNMTIIMQFATVVAPIVVALMQVVKSSVNLPKNVLPLLSLLIGVGVGALATPFTSLDLVMRLWAGGFAGMSAVGVYEVTLSYRDGFTKYDPAIKAQLKAEAEAKAKTDAETKLS